MSIQNEWVKSDTSFCTNRCLNLNIVSGPKNMLTDYEHCRS